MRQRKREKVKERRGGLDDRDSSSPAVDHRLRQIFCFLQREALFSVSGSYGFFSVLNRDCPLKGVMTAMERTRATRREHTAKMVGGSLSPHVIGRPINSPAVSLKCSEREKLL